MKDVYVSLKNLSEKKKSFLILGAVISSLCLVAILLIFFLHPRSDTYLYFGISIGIVLIGIFLGYYLFFYKYGHLCSIASFLKENKEAKENGVFSFLNEEGTNFYKKLGFRKLIFLDNDGKERTFLLLIEISSPFMEGKRYSLSFRKDYLLGYEEKENEG